jgi:hypothetical protein
MYFPIILNNVFLLALVTMFSQALVLWSNDQYILFPQFGPHRLTIQFDPALIAQLVERVTSNDEVAGSTPS